MMHSGIYGLIYQLPYSAPYFHQRVDANAPRYVESWDIDRLFQAARKAPLNVAATSVITHVSGLALAGGTIRSKVN